MATTIQQIELPIVEVNKKKERKEVKKELKNKNYDKSILRSIEKKMGKYEPEIVFGLVGSFTNKPPNVASVPFNSISLSPIETVVELIAVVVPLTNKLPLIVTLEPVVSMPSFIDADHIFNSSVPDPAITS